MLVSLHQGLFSYCGKIRDSCSVFRGVRLLQTAATWVVVWVFHITLIVGSNIFHHLAVAVVTGNFPPFFTFLFLILTGIMINRRYEKKILGLLYSVGKIALKVRNSHVKLRKLAFFLKKIKTEYP